MSNKTCTIFISHSSKDVKLINLAELAFESLNIKPYFAKNRIEGKNPVDKIVEAISTSKAFFALITPNVVTDQHTRDYVNFEIGVARANRMKIYVWIDTSVLLNKSYPRLIENVTDYLKFDCQSDEDCCNMLNAFHDIASKSDFLTVVQEANTQTVIAMDEAQKIAKNFVLLQKPNYSGIELSSSEPTSDGWLLKGNCSRSTGNSFGSYHWTVIIKGTTAFSYDFKAGAAWALG